ncbi:MAG: hypothetical protein KGI29_01465 [Pseudomonadota bacterium]|nr:hypothetical protein [Pseudomonadota bacterium]MDE3038137.1 hypothetical protein [Pseudomonadota bacterium]
MGNLQEPWEITEAINFLKECATKISIDPDNYGIKVTIQTQAGGEEKEKLKSSALGAFRTLFANADSKELKIFASSITGAVILEAAHLDKREQTKAAIKTLTEVGDMMKRNGIGGGRQR